MKVKLYVCRYEEMEVEIDDKFRKLAVDKPWEDPTISNDDYEECAKAVEQASGLPFGDENENGDCNEHFIAVVYSDENGEIMLEN